MNINYFNEYLDYKNKGLKQQTKAALARFINSFQSYGEKESWTMEYLPKLKLDANGCRIRNELFEEIIFPVLWNGYNNKNVNLIVWLVKLSQNYYQNNNVWEKMDYITDWQLIHKCYEIDPNNEEVIDLHLKIEIRQIAYSIHEWSSGMILIGNDSATKEQCKRLLEDIPFINNLDRNKKYQDFIKDYEDKLIEYMKNLEN